MKVVANDTAPFLKCPKNIGDWLKRDSQKRAWKTFRLYIQYLELKGQNPNCGTFEIKGTAKVNKRSYQRVIKNLIERGWASREGKQIHLRAYQHVWRDMGITRVRDKGILKFTYWKIDVGMFSMERIKKITETKIVDDEVQETKTVGGYLKEIEHEIRKRITIRRLAQTRYALRTMDKTTATFSSRSAGALFGYRSPYSGSKLRNKYFEVIPDESKPKFNRDRGRFEEPTKRIAI